MSENHLTVGDVSEFYGEPPWKIRRVVDALEAAGATIPRAGQYRLIPRDLLTDIGAELERRYPREQQEARADG